MTDDRVASERTQTAFVAAPASSERALADVEAHRLRGIMVGMCTSSLIAMVVVVAIGQDPLAVRIHAVALGASATASALTAMLLRRARPLYRQLALYVIVAQIAVLLTGYYFWGMFSAYGTLVPLTIYVAVGTASKREAVLGTLACALAQGALGLAFVFRWIEPHGLVEPVASRAPLVTQLAGLFLIEVFTVGAMVAGRTARKDGAAVLEAHNLAVRELARREALLAEAYADARAAREGGQGAVGRFTDQTLDGYKLGSILGRGAMGEVYAAVHGSNDLACAVKILAPHLSRDHQARDRFLREAKMVATLASPYIVRVLAASSPDALVPYLAMERLDGTDLAQLIVHRSMQLDEILELVEQLAAGLDVAHRAGVIHRDLKPSNIFATGSSPGRIWKLLDFGAAKWHDGQATLTRDNLVGTPGYMAPEQARGLAVTSRSDIYAFGVVLYRLITGVPAVVPGEVLSTVHEVAYRMPIQPSHRASQVSTQLEAVLAIALAKSPEMRFGSAGELATAFEQAVRARLDPATIARADAILRATPWGSWVDRAHRRD